MRKPAAKSEEQMEMLESMIGDASKKTRVRDPWSEDLDPVHHVEEEVISELAFDFVLEDLTEAGIDGNIEGFNN